MNILHIAVLRWRFLSRTFTTCLLLAAAPAILRAQSGTVFLDGRNLDYLTLQSGVLVWKVGCLVGANGPTSSIQRTPSGGGSIATYFNPPTCDGSSVRSRNVAVDAARRVYWATEDGRIVRLNATAIPGTQPVTLSTMADNNASQVVVSISANYIYWAETFGELSDSGSIYRAPIGGGARETVRNLTSTTGGGAVTLHALGNTNPQVFGESILFRRAFGKLARASERAVLPGEDPWTEATVVESIDTFAVVSGRIYYAETSAGSGTLIRARNVTGLANLVTHATLSAAGNPVVSDLTADASAVYWRELRSGTGPIWRKALRGTADPLIPELG